MQRQSAEQHSGSAPRRSAAVVAGNLPDELTSFIGRSAELARVRELLGEARLLTLVGAGGCGKTRLALQSATHGVERFPDGAWWVELAALENAELLATTVTSALGLRDRPGQTPVEVLCEHLARPTRVAGARQLRAPARGVRDAGGQAAALLSRPGGAGHQPRGAAGARRAALSRAVAQPSGGVRLAARGHASPMRCGCSSIAPSRRARASP